MVNHPEHSEIEQTISRLIREKTNGQEVQLINKDMVQSLFSVQVSSSCLALPDRHLLAFIYDAKTESKWQACDSKAHSMLRKNFNLCVLSIGFRNESERESQRIADEILNEAGLLPHEVPGAPQFFVWQKTDLFCSGYIDHLGQLHRCGKSVGVFAKKSSSRCQSCNMFNRLERERSQNARVGQ